MSTHTEESSPELVARMRKFIELRKRIASPDAAEEHQLIADLETLLANTRASISSTPATTDEVERVAQEQPFGCTAACLAMVLLCTYAEAAAKLATDPSMFDTQGHGYHVMESQLVQHGYAVARKWRVYQPGNQQRDEWPPKPFANLHWCEVIAGPRGAHAVIMLRDGTVLDPMSEERKTLADYPEVNFVSALVPVATLSPVNGEVERLREALTGLISACEGLEWNSFTEAGWNRVKVARAALASPEIQSEDDR